VIGFLRTRRRRRIRAEPFPAAWAEVLAANAPFVARLGDADRAHLLGDIQVFVAEKAFIGAGGLAITDEIKVTIAAAAARLVLHLDLSMYDDLEEVIVYPDAYVHPDRGPWRPGQPVGDATLGEAQTWGVVVLAWSAVKAGMRDVKDGHDTALHEFAHVLDKGDRTFDGTPPLRARDHYHGWAVTMARHFERLRRGDRAESKVLRDYGATNEAEFFAVATEAFFEKPRVMQEHAPDLYEELKRFYGEP
jgi:Mlc titration factor MtfA (ptsG expression regulator)